MIDKFEELCNGFTFVNLQNSPEITPDIFYIYMRNISKKEVSCSLIILQRELIPELTELRENALIYNKECIPIKNKLLLSLRLVLFFILKQRNKKHCIF